MTPFGPVIASFTYGNTLAQTAATTKNYWLTASSRSNGGTHIQELSLHGYDYAGNSPPSPTTLDGTRDETYGVDRSEPPAHCHGRLRLAHLHLRQQLEPRDVVQRHDHAYTTITTGANTVASITDGTNTRHFTYSASGNMATDDRVMDGAVAISILMAGATGLNP
jgi:hypothetical protein